MVIGDRRHANYREAPAAAGVDEGSDAAVDALEIRSAQVPLAQHGERLDKFLVGIAPEFSRSHLQHLIESGHVRVEGVCAPTASRRVRAGDAVELEIVPTEESRAYRPQAIALRCLYEDEHLLVLDKPAGLVVHPAPGNWSGTLLNALLAHHAGAAALPRAGIVHRLDKDTSGVMVVGKTLEAVTQLVRDIAARQVQRGYLAICHGAAPAALTIDAPIGRDPRARLRMAVVRGGREARTDVQCLATRAGQSALQCVLHTGRTHQIRVHLAHQGFPLVADALYGGPPALGLARQALHAARLALRHPVHGAVVQFRCPPPPDFAAAWASVGGATMRPD